MAEHEPTVEEILEGWSRDHGGHVTPKEWEFVRAMRLARKAGVGFGWMQQVIEWEWRCALSAEGLPPDGAHGPLALERALGRAAGKPPGPWEPGSWYVDPQSAAGGARHKAGDLDAAERERVANFLAAASKGTREAIGMIESARRYVEPQALAADIAANDDDPAGARYALGVAGDRLREALAVYEALQGFRLSGDVVADARSAATRRVEVALAEYVKAEARLRTVQEGGG